MKKILILVVMLGLIVSVPSSVFARDVFDALVGNNGFVHTLLKAAWEIAGRPARLGNSLIGGSFEADYGYDGYRHGGYATEYDYGHYGSGDNGYGYCHHGLDHNRFEGV